MSTMHPTSIRLATPEQAALIRRIAGLLTKRPHLAEALRITLDATLDAFERNTAQHPPPGFADMPAAIVALQQTVRGLEQTVQGLDERLARLEAPHPAGMPSPVTEEPRPSESQAAARQPLWTSGLGRNKRLTGAGKAEVERRLNAGDSLTSIAKTLEITVAAVKARARKLAVRAPRPSTAKVAVPPPEPTAELTDAQRTARLRGWLRAGITDEGLAQRLGVSLEEAAAQRQAYANGAIQAEEAHDAASSHVPSTSAGDEARPTPPTPWTVGVGRARRLTPEGERRLHDLIRTEASNSAIARDLGIDESRVRRIRRATVDNGTAAAGRRAPDPA
ncbi:hypothetical protein [Azospirillum sp. sgz301742]